MSYFDSKGDYIEKIAKKHTGNDFMNIEKANNHYKKALSINLKTLIPSEIWEDLIDITNIRNMIIHNNGRIDNRFKSTRTFTRLTDAIEDNMLFLDQKMIKHYFDVVTRTAEIISDVFRGKYSELKNGMIAMHHFVSSRLPVDFE